MIEINNISDHNYSLNCSKMSETENNSNSTSNVDVHYTDDESDELQNDTSKISLPKKSRVYYERCYKLFLNWLDTKGTNSFCEQVFLDYFHELSDNYKPTTLWTTYSMLRSTVQINCQIDISGYQKLNDFLKLKSRGWNPKKAKTLTTEQISKFIKEAPDEKYLLSKVALIFGITGACKKRDLYRITVSDVDLLESKILVTIKSSGTRANKIFAITGKYFEICKNYINLRPDPCNIRAFFLNYGRGKCNSLRVGINKFGNIGKVIASYLNLPDPNLYTGNCFRRTSVALSVMDAGGVISRPDTDGAATELNSDDDDSSDDECLLGKRSPDKAAPSIQAQGLLHGMSCKICNEDIYGFRFACVECVDFDMCSTCEQRGEHATHHMLRIPRPQPIIQVLEMLQKVREVIAEFVTEPEPGPAPEPELQPIAADEEDEPPVIVKIESEEMPDDPLHIKVEYDDKMDTSTSVEAIPYLQDQVTSDATRGTKPATSLTRLEVYETFEDRRRKSEKLRLADLSSSDRIDIIMDLFGENFKTKSEIEKHKYELLKSVGVIIFEIQQKFMKCAKNYEQLLKFHGDWLREPFFNDLPDVVKADTKPDTGIDTQDPFSVPHESNVMEQAILEIDIKDEPVGPAEDEAQTDDTSQIQNLPGPSNPRPPAKRRATSTSKLVESERALYEMSRKMEHNSANSKELPKSEIEIDSDDDLIPLKELSKMNNSDDLIPLKELSAMNDSGNDLIPLKELPGMKVSQASRKRYEYCYNMFMQWQEKNERNAFSEDVLLDYFKDISKKYKPPTLWANYSMLRTIIKRYNQVNISKYRRLNAFLYVKSEGYQAEQPNILSLEDMIKFVNEAPNDIYLFKKVVVIFWILSGCRRVELCNLKYSDVEDLQSKLLVHLRSRSPKKGRRMFTVTGEYYEICKEYMALRPVHCPSNRFFMTYRAGKCSAQHVGINQFGPVCGAVATYLGLPDPKSYKSFCRIAGGVVNTPKITPTADDARNEIAEHAQRAECEMSRNIEHNSATSDSNKDSTPTNDLQAEVTGHDSVTATGDLSVEITKDNFDSDIGSDLDNEPTPTPQKELLTKKLPANSSKKYEDCYTSFMEWREMKQTNSFSEDVILDFFVEKSKILKPTTLWTFYSMLKCTIQLHNQIDISKYQRLSDFLKCKSQGYRAKKSKILSPEDISKFMNKAPDSKYLFTKVALIFGILSRCHRKDLFNIQYRDVEDLKLQSKLLVNLRSKYPNTPNLFTVTGKYYEICKKYIALRPKKCNIKKFFVTYRNGKCTAKHVGINQFSFVSRVVATYLGLPEPKSYTGHGVLKSAAAAAKIMQMTEEPPTEHDDRAECKMEHNSATTVTNKDSTTTKDPSTKVKDTLPKTSKKIYENTYSIFTDWQKKNNINSFSENDLLLYFREIGKKLKPTSLWSQYSMLKATIILYNQVDISKYRRLHAFLKRRSKGYQSNKTTKIFKPEDVIKFINQAPDSLHLFTKVVLIFGVVGGCGRKELCYIQHRDVKDLHTKLLVNLRNNDSKIRRSFIVTGKYYEICKKYIGLRPRDCNTSRFFLSYRGGKCTVQNVGINYFSTVCHRIARYLDLPEPEAYTPLCFRKTHAALNWHMSVQMADKTALLADKMGPMADDLKEQTITKTEEVLIKIELDV